MKWISVDDRLPEENQEIVMFGRSYSMENYVSTGEFGGVHSNGPCWLEYPGDADGCLDIMSDVTHWMPLPEPPIEEK